MAATATTNMVAGMFYAWLAFRDSSGYPLGTLITPDTPVVNTVYGAYRVKHPVSVTDPKVNRLVATRKGGQAIQGKRVLGPDSIEDFELTLDAYDEQFHAYISGSLVDVTTVTNWAATSLNAQKATLPRFVLGVIVGFETEGGVDQFGTIIYPNVTIQPVWLGATQQGGDNPNPLTYKITPDVSTRSGTARLYSATSLSVTDNKDMVTVYRYDYPIYLTTYIADGIASTFTLPYKPVSSDATGAATNSITKAGVTTAVTSVNTSSGLVTLAAAGSSGDKWVLATPINTNWS